MAETPCLRIMPHPSAMPPSVGSPWPGAGVGVGAGMLAPAPGWVGGYGWAWRSWGVPRGWGTGEAKPSVMNARCGWRVTVERPSRRAPNLRTAYAAAGSNMSLWMGVLDPSGSSSLVSSKTITPLHSSPHPCSGW
jgi:hypothetical protein